MSHGQWRNSHDKKQAKGGLRHRLIDKIRQKISAMYKNVLEEWFCDVFWGEYAKFIGLIITSMTIEGRASRMLQLNVGPLHLAIEKWRSIKVNEYG